ncbi:MAG: sphingomyelin phosphodiesterase [Bacteroidia bacterium]|nr:sphingomyelin phosphodiesterase [Bacteroidia bacterium]
MKFIRHLRFFLFCGLVLYTTLLRGQDNSTTEQIEQCDRELETISILSWNVFMLPPPFFRTHQIPRCKAIIEFLNNSSYDVLVLQEIFYEKVRSKFVKGLINCYPYHYGPCGTDKFLRQDGGVMIFSKYPIESSQQIAFRDKCKGGDCFSDKGALLAEIVKNHKKIQIVGTHLQSMEDSISQGIRVRQYEKIKQFLLRPFHREDVPQLIVGDLNTCKVTQRPFYKRMLDIFGAEDSHRSKKDKSDFTYDSDSNAIVKANHLKYQRFFDYVLFRRNPGRYFKARDFVIHLFRKRDAHSKMALELSDHFAVEAVIEWE